MVNLFIDDRFDAALCIPEKAAVFHHMEIMLKQPKGFSGISMPGNTVILMSYEFWQFPCTNDVI